MGRLFLFLIFFATGGPAVVRKSVAGSHVCLEDAMQRDGTLATLRPAVFDKNQDGKAVAESRGNACYACFQSGLSIGYVAKVGAPLPAAVRRKRERTRCFNEFRPGSLRRDDIGTKSNACRLHEDDADSRVPRGNGPPPESHP